MPVLLMKERDARYQSSRAIGRVFCLSDVGNVNNVCPRMWEPSRFSHVNYKG